MGKRKRTKRVLEDLPEPTVPARKGWNLEDKTTLLTALKKYGHDDIDSIWTMLPGKTKPAIRTMIHKIKEKAKPLSHTRNSALDTWLKSGMFNDDTAPIPEALKYISLFEDHPLPDESGGIDFRAAYDYLHRMTLGYPPVTISERTLGKLNELIEQTRNEVWPRGETDVIGYLGKLDKRRHSVRCYPPMKKLYPTESNYETVLLKSAAIESEDRPTTSDYETILLKSAAILDGEDSS